MDDWFLLSFFNRPRRRWLIFERHWNTWKPGPSTHWTLRTIQRAMAWSWTTETTSQNPHVPNQRSIHSRSLNKVLFTLSQCPTRQLYRQHGKAHKDIYHHQSHAFKINPSSFFILQHCETLAHLNHLVVKDVLVCLETFLLWNNLN